MGFLKKAIASGMAAKALKIAQREAAKPENQRKARELVGKLRNRGTRPR